MLYIKKSTLPRCGLGLFSSVDIEKGEYVAEYKGEIYTWKKCIERAAEEDKAGYVFYVNRNYCIDAYDFPLELARYANDAKGLRRKKDVTNNCEYLIKGKRVYIVSKKKLKAHTEILAPYGKDYWDEFEECDDDN